MTAAPFGAAHDVNRRRNLHLEVVGERERRRRPLDVATVVARVEPVDAVNHQRRLVPRADDDAKVLTDFNRADEEDVVFALPHDGVVILKTVKNPLIIFPVKSNANFIHQLERGRKFLHLIS